MSISMKRRLKKFCAPLFSSHLGHTLFAGFLYREIVETGNRVSAIGRNEDELDDSYWAGRLRKYVHIIDKGLQRNDFEKGHSSGMLKMAKDALARIKSQDFLNDPSVVWAREKIKEYELRQIHKVSSDMYPAASQCSYDELMGVIKNRRSVRTFIDRPVEDETVKCIVEPIDWSPNSCNRQTAKVFATNNSVLAAQCMRLCAGSSGFGDFVPLFLCFCSDVRVYEMPHEIMMPYIDVSLGIQNCNLIAHTLGISLTMLTWAQHSPSEDKELRKLLEIPPHYKIIVNAAGGYPLCNAPVPARKSTKLVLQLCR